mmetsp:Transcript_16537/g.27836  ORF Transcript_16537/g.27836 Transcript_16537/m.27836 type:complete len:582 (+) Transcript_16537:190-1935(+)
MEEPQAFFDDQEKHASKRQRGLGFDSDPSAQPQETCDSAVPVTITLDATVEFEAAKKRAAEMAAKLIGSDEAVGIAGGGGGGVKRPREWEATLTEKIYIPVGEDPDMDWVGLFLGPNGSMQEEIESETRCQIELKGKGSPEAEETAEEPLHVVVGACDQDDLDAGCRRIRGLISQERQAAQPEEETTVEATNVNNGTSAVAEQSHGTYGKQPATSFSAVQGSVSKTVQVPNAKVGMVIGRGGETIQSLQAKTGAHIQVEKDGAFERGENTRPVHVTGTQEQVDLAEKLILETVSQPSFREAEGIEEDNIDVSNTKIGLVIGRGGETIRSLQDRTKTRIQVQPDPRDGSDRRVTISGHKEAVAMAKKLIEDIVSAPPGTNFNHGGGGGGGGGHYGGYHQQPAHSGWGQQQQQQQGGYQQHPYYQQQHQQHQQYYGQYYQQHPGYQHPYYQQQQYQQPYYGQQPQGYYGQQQPGYDYSQYYNQQYQQYYGGAHPQQQGAHPAAAGQANWGAQPGETPPANGEAVATPGEHPAAEAGPVEEKATPVKATPVEATPVDATPMEATPVEVMGLVAAAMASAVASAE